MTKKVFITHAKRSAITNFGGSLRSLGPVDIGTQVLKSILDQTPELKTETSMVIIGNVLSAGHGQNIARQVAYHAGIDVKVPSFTLNQVCGSSIQAIISGMHYILTDNADCVIVGGTESMSNAAYVLPNHRWENKMGHNLLIDTMIHDGLWDAFNDIHMGITAETIAKQWEISRKSQDEFALESQLKASKAQESGKFANEISPITVKSKRETHIIDADEFIRHDISLEKLNQLKPVFDKNGTITAGNASGLNDGSAFLVLMSEEKAKELNCNTDIEIVSSSITGNDPSIMGVAPIESINQLLKKSKLTLNDIDLIELNEAFAAQSIAVKQTLNIPDEKLNINGGAIALGHPIGASGARITTTLFHEMKKQQSTFGISSLCVGGGQGLSLLLKQS